MDAGKVKPGNYIVIEGEPCKVSSVVKSKPGKHGSTKAKIEAVGLFDGKKRIILKPTSASIEQPDIKKSKAQVIMVSKDSVQLMDMEDYTTYETSIPDEFKGKLEAGKEVITWKIGSRVIIKELR